MKIWVLICAFDALFFGMVKVSGQVGGLEGWYGISSGILTMGISIGVIIWTIRTKEIAKWW